MPTISEMSLPSSKAGANAEELFAQADTNRDGVIDRNEFLNFVQSSNSGAGGGSFRVKRTGGSHESSSHGSFRGRSPYRSAGYSPGVGFESASRSSTHQSVSYESTGGLDDSAIRQAASYTADFNAAWSKYGAEVQGIGLYVDSHPEIIRREATSGAQVYTQKIRMRYLQPPPVPPPGVS
jgi:hypothetical protein